MDALPFANDEVEKTNAWTAEGRIAQFEYAAEAVGRSGLCVGILCKDGAVLAGECRIKSQLHDLTKFKEKIHQLHPTVACAVAGRDADANVLLNRLENKISQYIYNFHEMPTCKEIAQAARELQIWNAHQIERRPLAVSTLYVGWTQRRGYQLMMSEPSGNVMAWKMFAIGRNAVSANHLLKDKCAGKEMSLEEAKNVALEVLAKNIGVQYMNAMKVEMATFQSVGGDCKMNIHSHEEVMEICEKFKQEYAQKQK